MPSSPEYVRVYQSVVDDQKFIGIYDDDHHFATWVRLLMAADALWPASCPLPASARKASVKALVAAEIVDVFGSRFRVRGLDAERERRQSMARASANERWSRGNASGVRPESERNANAMQAESERNAAYRGRASALGSSKGNRSVEDPARDDEPEWPVLSWLASVGATVQPSGNGYHVEVVKLVERQGAATVLAAMQARHAAGDKSARQIIYGAANDLEPISRPSGTKPKGLGPTIEEVENAFQR